MITWPLAVCVMFLTKCPSCVWVSGKHVPAMKNANNGCGNSQKRFTAMSAWIPFVFLCLTLSWVFFLFKALYACLKCNFQQSHTPADCKTLLWGDVASLQQWAHIHRLPNVLLHPLHCHPRSTHRCSSQEACGMITVESKNCFLYIFICFSYASEPWFYCLPNLRIQNSFSAIGSRQWPVHTFFFFFF